MCELQIVTSGGKALVVSLFQIRVSLSVCMFTTSRALLSVICERAVCGQVCQVKGNSFDLSCIQTSCEAKHPITCGSCFSGNHPPSLLYCRCKPFRAPSAGQLGSMVTQSLTNVFAQCPVSATEPQPILGKRDFYIAISADVRCSVSGVVAHINFVFKNTLFIIKANRGFFFINTQKHFSSY